jgi:hypothetical protein
MTEFILNWFGTSLIQIKEVNFTVNITVTTSRKVRWESKEINKTVE